MQAPPGGAWKPEKILAFHCTYECPTTPNHPTLILYLIPAVNHCYQGTYSPTRVKIFKLSTQFQHQTLINPKSPICQTLKDVHMSSSNLTTNYTNFRDAWCLIIRKQLELDFSPIRILSEHKNIKIESIRLTSPDGCSSPSGSLSRKTQKLSCGLCRLAARTLPSGCSSGTQN